MLTKWYKHQEQQWDLLWAYI